MITDALVYHTHAPVTGKKHGFGLFYLTEKHVVFPLAPFEEQLVDRDQLAIDIDEWWEKEDQK